MTKKAESESRRRLLKQLAAGGGVAVTATELPESWTKPVVESVLLPAHARATGIPECDTPLGPIADVEFFAVLTLGGTVSLLEFNFGDCGATVAINNSDFDSFEVEQNGLVVIGEITGTPNTAGSTLEGLVCIDPGVCGGCAYTGTYDIDYDTGDSRYEGTLVNVTVVNPGECI